MEDVTVTALYLDYGGGYRNLRVLKFTEKCTIKSVQLKKFFFYRVFILKRKKN